MGCKVTRRADVVEEFTPSLGHLELLPALVAELISEDAHSNAAELCTSARIELARELRCLVGGEEGAPVATAALRPYDPASVEMEIEVLSWLISLLSSRNAQAACDRARAAIRSRQRTPALPHMNLVQAEANPATCRVLVGDITKRGVRLRDLLQFFELFCGVVVFEDEERMDPICQATKLAKACNRYNQLHRRDICMGKVKPWEPNLYAVNSWLIMEHTREERVSMAELWNKGTEVTVDIFISHFWGEDFGEFLQSTLRFTLHHTTHNNPELSQADVCCLAEKVAFYICAFSNNQHNIKAELGDSIRDSPFYKVLNAPSTQLVVMNVDQCASALLRAWCGFEFCLAHELGKTFVLNTRFGPLREVAPDKDIVRVWIRHMFDILQDMDISQSMATSQSDFNMILKHVCQFRGTDGSGPEGLNRILKRIVADQVLPMAAADGSASFLEDVLSARANPNFLDHHGLSALTYAVAMQGDESTAANLLRGAGAVTVARPEASLVVAMYSGTADARSWAIQQVEDVQVELEESGQYFAYSEALRIARSKQEAARARQLCKQLGNADPHERAQAISELGKLGNKAVPYLARMAGALRDADSSVRYNAATAFGELGAPALPFVASLELLCGDQEGGVCYAAAQALQNLRALSLDTVEQ